MSGEVGLPDPAREIADWLVELGYPIDWSGGDVLPPAFMQAAIEDAWVRRDGPEDADAIRYTIAEEGGWLHARSRCSDSAPGQDVAS